MATPQEKLAQALKELQNLQNNNDITIIHASELSAPHKKLLKNNGFIKEVIKGFKRDRKKLESEQGDLTRERDDIQSRIMAIELKKIK